MTGNPPPSLSRRLLHSLRAWPRGTAGTLDLLPDGFEYMRRRRPVRIRWDEIMRVDAGMRDYLTVDLFYTIIHTAREKIVVDELVDGFRQLEESVFQHWPHVRERWLALQGTPHHQPQCETLWQR
ncbi:MAG TPA: hypothetical protein VII49_11200 [Rhizomicrobium sp.]